MSIIPSLRPQTIAYPTSDGKPMAETDRHRDVMFDTIHRLQFWFADEPKLYVSGNLLMYYVRGNNRKHVSPDVFVVRGIKKGERLYYLLWEEKKPPAMITEITSSSTRKEDMKTKFVLYRDVLKVKEYFQFDPFGDYLKPQLQGYRLHRGDYVPIEPVSGRLPSKVVNLHLEADGAHLQLYDPATATWIPTPEQRAQTQAQRAAVETERANTEAHRAQTEAQRADAESVRAEAEAQRALEQAQRARNAEERAAQTEHEKDRLAEEINRLREELAALRQHNA